MKRSTNYTALFQSIYEDERVTAISKALAEDALLHLVGGTVRDALLGCHGQDLDFASILEPSEITARLERAGIRVIPTGLKHQTVTALPVPGVSPVEITTFKKGPSIREDLAHRDFTINAVAVDLLRRELLDPEGGLEDLNSRLIRAVGSPRERYDEDPLRILRMIRFASTLQFAIEEQTLDEAKPFVPHLTAVSVERIREELSKILTGPKPSTGFKLLADLGVLDVILPEIAVFVSFEQNRFHHSDLFLHTCEVMDKTEPDLTLRLAALFHDVGKPPTLTVDDDGERHFFRHENVGAQMTKEILERLRYSNSIADNTAVLVATHMRPLDAGPGGLRRLLRDTDELYPRWRALKEADASSIKVNQEDLKRELAQFDAAIAQVKKGPQVSPFKNLALKGEDLIGLGLRPGPNFGEILRELHEEVLDIPELNTKEHLLNRAREIAEKKNLMRRN